MNGRVDALSSLSGDQLLAAQIALIERCGQREVYESGPLLFQVRYCRLVAIQPLMTWLYRRPSK
jgi:hypothetical protein